MRARVDALREEAVRVAAALGEAELALEHVIITKVTPAAVIAGHGVTFEARQEPETVAPGAGRATVPVWRAGLDGRALPAGCRPMWTVLAEASEVVRAKDAAKALGFEATAAKLEGARSELQRLVRRGWAVEPSPWAFRIAAGPAGTG